MAASPLNGLLNMPTLASYLGKNDSSSGLFDTVARNLINQTTGAQAVSDGAGNGVTLSDEAKALIAANNGKDDGKLSGVQKSGQNFLMSFFDRSGVDFEKLAPDAAKFIAGLQDVIAGTTAATRDHSTDAAEMKYSGGTKSAYTLAGNGSRLRIGIEQDSAGKPVKLTVTDIVAGRVETADIRLTREDGKLTGLSIERTQREYANGHMTKLAELDPLEIDLYRS